MPLILPPLIYASMYFGGQDSEGIKVESRFIHCMILRLKSRLSSNKRLYTINQIGAFFVIRAKTNLHYNTERWKRRMPDSVLSDQLITLSWFYSQQNYPEKIRKVIYWDEEQNREFTYLTNATDISALEVANLYTNRWQVELFFKWLKQHLRIKKFWGTNENAVRIQIYTAITA